MSDEVMEPEDNGEPASEAEAAPAAEEEAVDPAAEGEVVYDSEAEAAEPTPNEDQVG